MADGVRRLTKRFLGRHLMRIAPIATTRVLYRHAYGRWPSLRQPRLFSEYLMHRKLADNDSRFPQLGDKLAVRDYIATRVGEQHLANVFTSGDSWDELDHNALPDDFVLKTTRSGVRIVRGFKPEHGADLAQWSSKALASRHGENQGEWWYAARPNRLFAEELLLCTGGRPPDEYKFYVFHGRTQVVKSIATSDGTRRISLRDPQWRPIPGHYANLRSRTYPNLSRPELIPATTQQMTHIAEAIASDLTFARIDLYDVDGRIIVGEVTLCPSAGYLSLGDPSYDALLGALWSNPELSWNMSAQN